MQSVSTLHVHPYSISILMSLSIWILQSVDVDPYSITISLSVDPYSLCISIPVSIWILQSVEHSHTLCRLTVYKEYTANP